MKEKREEKKEEKKIYRKPELNRKGNLRDVGQLTNTTGKG